MLTRSVKFTLIFSVILALFFVAPLYAQEFYPANVRDISDRAYEPAVIELLDGARESIVVSMYFLGVTEKSDNPVMLLLNDLLEARKRGASVTLYLNTKFQGVNEYGAQLAENPVIKKLQDAGCTIHLIPTRRRVHDKLIIVDGRFVVEASTNWSISALKNNYESATLIDSSDLAKIKLVRLKSFVLPEGPPKKPDKDLYTKNILEKISLPEALITDKKYLSRMLSRQAERPMNLYLLLLGYSHSIEKRDFFIDMQSIGLSLGLPESWDNVDLRRQVIKNLRVLKEYYKLINVKFFRNKDAWIELADIPGDTVVIDSKIIAPEKELPARLKFYLIAQALLKTKGEDINAMSAPQVAERFSTSQSSILRIRRDLKEKDAISHLQKEDVSRISKP